MALHLFILSISQISLSFTSHTNPPWIVFLRPTHECTNTHLCCCETFVHHLYLLLIFAPKPIFQSLTPLLQIPLSLSDTHDKKKVLLFSLSRAFIPYITLFLFHHVLLFKFWIFITACWKQILGFWWWV